MSKLHSKHSSKLAIIKNFIIYFLCYLKGNNSYIPDDFVIGASIDKISELNDRCLKNAVLISNNLIKIDYSKIKPIKLLPPLLPDKESESISEPISKPEKKSTPESNQDSNCMEK